MKIKKLQIFSFVTCLLLVFFASNITFSQWTLVGAVTGAGDYPTISVVDENTVFIIGGPEGHPAVFRSTNGGEDFTILDTTGLGNLELYSGWAVDANLIFVGNGGSVGGLQGGNASFYKTTNGGSSWILIDSTGGTDGFFVGIVFSRITPMFGIAVSDPPNGYGEPYYVSTTTDGGLTWNPPMDPPPPGIPGALSCAGSVMVIDSLFFGFGVYQGASRIYMTSNGGADWFIGDLGITGDYVHGFAFSEDKLRGIAATPMALPTISRTSDGVTWSPINTNTGLSPSWSSPCKWIPGTDICYLASEGGSNGLIAKSIDGGLTWANMNTSGVIGITHMDFYTDGDYITGYAVTTTGRVLKLYEQQFMQPYRRELMRQTMAMLFL